MFKVGDKLDSLRGPCVVVAIETGRDCGVRLKYDDDDMRWVTPDGKLYPHHPHPFAWFPETGHGPEVGERPKWKPEKPTWCWVWNEFEEDRIIRLVAKYDDWGYRSLCVEGSELKLYSSYWKNAEPLSGDEVPDWWPEEWR